MRRSGALCGDRRKCCAGPEHSDKKLPPAAYKTLACMACADIMQLYSLIKLFHMHILIIHQDFPDQYKHLSPALTARSNWVLVLTLKLKTSHQWQGVEVVPYVMNRGNSKDIHRWLGDLESKIICAESCFDAAMKIR